MKDRIDIDQIRILLHKYYEAETTPDEENLLKTFFQGTPVADIPEAMADDHLLFNSMSALHSEISDMEIPDNLLDKVSEVTEVPSGISLGNSQRHWPRRIASLAAAACACILLYFGIQQSAFDHQSNRIPKMTENASEVNRLDDGFVEITDPKEAEKIMSEIASLLVANTKQSNEAIRHLEKTMDEYKELTKSILQ